MGRHWAAFAIAWGVVVLILSILALVQEGGLRRVTEVTGRFAAICLSLICVGAVLLILLGVLS